MPVLSTSEEVRTGLHAPDLTPTGDQTSPPAQLLGGDPHATASATGPRRAEGEAERERDAAGQEAIQLSIGIHYGTAIVGRMGPPDDPIVSALGDDVNVAARLEQQSKVLGCTLVVSLATVETAGVEFPGVPTRNLAVRGRGREVAVHLVTDPLTLPGVDGLLAELPAGD